jgi:DNA-binding FrmR family transcriptional regulator
MEKDSNIKKSIVHRFSRLEGQINAIRRMVEDGEECEKIVTQLSAVHAALESATKHILAGFLKECMKECIAKGMDQDEALDRFASLMLHTRW